MSKKEITLRPYQENIINETLAKLKKLFFSYTILFVLIILFQKSI